MARDRAGEPNPTKFLREAGRAALEPLGVTLRGRGRNWVDDRGWWIVNVEFQPSGSSKGSYINVGVQWLWRPFPGHSFEFGDRVRLRSGDKSVQFIEYQNETQFRGAARELATAAAREVLAYRKLFATLGACIKALRKEEAPYRYDLGVAYGLAGKKRDAARLFDAAHVRREPRDWEIQQNHLLDELSSLVGDTPAFRARILDIVNMQRRTLKLPDDLPADLPRTM